MEGEEVWVTAALWYSPVVKKRCRMSFTLVATSCCCLKQKVVVRRRGGWGLDRVDRWSGISSHAMHTRPLAFFYLITYQLLDGEAHALGVVAREDVPEVARRHREGQLRVWYVYVKAW